MPSFLCYGHSVILLLPLIYGLDWYGAHTNQMSMADAVVILLFVSSTTYATIYEHLWKNFSESSGKCAVLSFRNAIKGTLIALAVQKLCEFFLPHLQDVVTTMLYLYVFVQLFSTAVYLVEAHLLLKEMNAGAETA